jgi:hypothetical protein
MQENEYLIGVMITPVEAPGADFRPVTSRATTRVEQILAQRVPNARFWLTV